MAAAPHALSPCHWWDGLPRVARTHRRPSAASCGCGGAQCPRGTCLAVRSVCRPCPAPTGQPPVPVVRVGSGERRTAFRGRLVVQRECLYRNEYRPSCSWSSAQHIGTRRRWHWLSSRRSSLRATSCVRPVAPRGKTATCSRWGPLRQVRLSLGRQRQRAAQVRVAETSASCSGIPLLSHVGSARQRPPGGCHANAGCPH